jgi:hypothetical protein
MYVTGDRSFSKFDRLTRSQLKLTLGGMQPAVLASAAGCIQFFSSYFQLPRLTIYVCQNC